MALLVSEWYHKRIPDNVDADDLPAGLRALLAWGSKKRPR
jgi:hypothetical protein